jgi:hypothetical protein
MTASPIEPSSPVSAAARVLFVAAGLVALGIGTIITLGAALAGSLAIGLAAWLFSRKGRRLTRRGAWLASVGGTVAVLAALMAFAVLADNSTSKPMSAAERAEQRARATQAMPEWLRAVNPNAQRQSAAVDSMAVQLLENKAVVVWAGLMGAVIASVLIGTIAGSFAWGGVMLVYRGAKGHWMPSSVEAPAGL